MPCVATASCTPSLTSVSSEKARHIRDSGFTGMWLLGHGCPWSHATLQHCDSQPEAHGGQCCFLPWPVLSERPERPVDHMIDLLVCVLCLIHPTRLPSSLGQALRCGRRRLLSICRLEYSEISSSAVQGKKYILFLVPSRMTCRIAYTCAYAHTLTHILKKHC